MKTVLITGAGRGIGLALTREFIQHGFFVIGTYRDEKSAAELLDLDPQKALSVKADVSDAATFGPLKQALEKSGPLDILVNNAGVIGDKAPGLAGLDIDGVAGVLNVNTLGPMRITQLALPFLTKNAHIAHITSLMGSIADTTSGGYYDYRMSKTALNMFNKCLALEFPQRTCLVLHPGWVQTDMGGAGASVPVDDCARGLYKVITDAGPEQTGHFFDFRGRELPW